MKITDIPFSILRTQYRIARIPLTLFERGVLDRMEPEAPARVFYRRAVGALDAAAGSALRDTDLEERGLAEVQRAAELGEAARLDEVAERRVQQADAQLREKRRQAEAAPQEARTKAQRKIADARTQADATKQAATENAAARTSAAKKRIDDAADQKIKAAQKAKANAQNRSRAAEKSVTNAAKAELDDAADKRRAANGARAHADRLDELGDAEKEKRQAARARKP